MKIVVDTNIVFSTLLNPKSNVGELLMNVEGKFDFFAPELLLEEIERYHDKIKKYTKLDDDALKTIKLSVLDTIDLVSENLISENNWIEAYKITENIDEDDTPFVALSLELEAKLWTGDKKLSTTIKKKFPELTITTNELLHF